VQFEEEARLLVREDDEEDLAEAGDEADAT
jgi:hypothetical protein